MKKFQSFRKDALSLIPVTLTTLILAVLVILATNYGGTNLVEKDLITIVPIFLSLNFILLIILFGVNFKDIFESLRKIKKSTWILLLLIFLIGFILRMYVVPHTHRILFDEDLYLNMGREMLLEGKGCLCNYGTTRECLNCFNYKDPKGYPFLLTILFFLFGTSETVAFNFTVLLTSLSIVLIFLICCSIFKDEKVGLFTAFLMALSTVHIIWSGTVAAEPIFLFFMLLSMWIFFLYAKTKKLRMLLLLVVLLTFSIQFKAEGAIFLFLIVGLILFYDRPIKKWRDTKYFLLPLLLFFFVAGPYLTHLYYFATTNDWESPTGKKFSFDFGKRNIPSNLSFLIRGEPGIEQPIIYVFLIVLGFLYLIKLERKALYLPLLWFILFFVMYGFFFAGDVRWGSNERYTLTYYTPLLIFGGYGLYAIEKELNKKFKHVLSSLFIFFLVFVFFWPSVSSISTPADKIEEGIQSRTYHDFVVSNMDKIGKDCYVFTHVPSIFLVYGKNSGQLWALENDQSVFQKTNCVIYDEGYWCNVDPFRGPNSICKIMHEKYKLSLLAQYPFEKYGHTYTLYQVLPM